MFHLTRKPKKPHLKEKDMHDACAVMLHCEQSLSCSDKKGVSDSSVRLHTESAGPKVRKGPQEQQDVEKGAKRKGQLSHIT